MSRIVGDLKERTLAFGVAIMRLLSLLPHENRGWIVSKQLGRSATSVGANVWEADAALTDAEFASKISIARREASETIYWLELSIRAGLLDCSQAMPHRREAEELMRILGTIVLRTQQRLRGDT